MWKWQQIVEGLAAQGSDASARIESHRIEHPRDGGLTPTFGLPRGQRATFRARLSDGSTLSVDDFGGYYEARINRAVPKIERPAPPAADDALGSVLGMSALGALLGLALGQSERSAMTGALVGGALGLGHFAVRQADEAPEASKAALSAADSLARLAIATNTTPTRTVRALPAAGASHARTGAKRRRST
jgi:hypothetical protein